MRNSCLELGEEGEESEWVCWMCARLVWYDWFLCYWNACNQWQIESKLSEL